MEKKEKKGFFSSLFTSNNKGCGCGLQIEEVPANITEKQVSEKQEEKKEEESSEQQTNQANRGCGC